MRTRDYQWFGQGEANQQGKNWKLNFFFNVSLEQNGRQREHVQKADYPSGKWVELSNAVLVACLCRIFTSRWEKIKFPVQKSIFPPGSTFGTLQNSLLAQTGCASLHADLADVLATITPPVPTPEASEDVPMASEASEEAPSSQESAMREDMKMEEW